MRKQRAKTRGAVLKDQNPFHKGRIRVIASDKRPTIWLAKSREKGAQ